jgi:hypothetical protein
LLERLKVNIFGNNDSALTASARYLHTNSSELFFEHLVILTYLNEADLA